MTTWDEREGNVLPRRKQTGSEIVLRLRAWIFIPHKADSTNEDDNNSNNSGRLSWDGLVCERFFGN